MYFFDLDLDALLLSILGFLLGKGKLNRAKEKNGLSRVFSVLTGCLLLAASVLYFFASFDFGEGDGEDGEEEEEEA